MKYHRLIILLRSKTFFNKDEVCGFPCALTPMLVTGIARQSGERNITEQRTACVGVESLWTFTFAPEEQYSPAPRCTQHCSCESDAVGIRAALYDIGTTEEAQG